MSDFGDKDINLGQKMPDINLTKESKLGPEEVELHKIFGADAKIEKVEDVWKVRVLLKDATCRGGQVVEAELLRKTKRDGNTWFETKDLKIDDTSLPSIFKNNFIFKTNSEDVAKSDEDIDMVKHLRKFIGTTAFESGLIRVASLEDGDALASLFHEIGHTRDKTPSMFVELDFYTVQQYVKDSDKSYTDEEISDIRRSGEKILESEMKAHKFAIKAIEYLRSKGKDMFKDDEELYRLKSFLITTTIARFNGVPKFIELVGQDRINQILEI
jgi:hypothetical protein